MYKILTFSILFIITSFSMTCNSEILSNNIEFVKLRQINVSKDLFLRKLLSDVFEDDIRNETSKTNYYSLSLEKFEARNGTLAVVTELFENCIENKSAIGYIDYEGNTVYVFSDGHYDLEYSKPVRYRKVEYRKPSIGYVKEPIEWFYFLKKGNCYARYVFHFGWLWFFDKRQPEEIKTNKFIVIEPKRKNK